MSDLDDALAAPPMTGASGRPGQRCKVGRILDAVTAAQRAAIIERLHSEGRETGWTDHMLSSALARGGHPVSYSVLSAHRRRVCNCGTFDESETP